MRYTVRVSYVDVIGPIWMPTTTAAMRYTLDRFAIENIRAYGDGTITREAVDEWLSCHSGDFQSIADFSASIEDGDDTLDFEWSDPDSELVYMDSMYGDEE